MASLAKSHWSYEPVGDTQALWNTVEILQGRLRDLLGGGAASSRTNAPTSPGARIGNIVRARAMRARFFKAELFADPAWDMLLDLYRAQLDQHRVCVTSLCQASGVPTSTALRWLRALEDDKLITRRNDPLDGRRSFVALSVKAADAIAAYFAAIGNLQPL